MPPFPPARFRVPEIVQALAALTAARTEARALVLDSMAQVGGVGFKLVGIFHV